MYSASSSAVSIRPIVVRVDVPKPVVRIRIADIAVHGGTEQKAAPKSLLTPMVDILMIYYFLAGTPRVTGAKTLLRGKRTITKTSAGSIRPNVVRVDVPKPVVRMRIADSADHGVRTRRIIHIIAVVLRCACAAAVRRIVYEAVV